MAKDYSYYFAQLRKTENHREKKAEVEIRKLYKELLSDTKQFIADEYYELAEDGELTYEILRSKGQDARFLAEVERRLDGISPKVSQEIQQTVEEIYEMSYSGMVSAVRFSDTKGQLKESLDGIRGVSVDTIKAHVENPIAGLTLSDTLERNRKSIIWDIKREIGVGLTLGDRYETMARRIAKSLDGDYKKAITIVRTEAGRAREAGHHDSAKEINDTLKQGVTNMRMTKTWKSMKDGSVRDQHQSMDGVTVGMDEDFTLPDGTKTKAPRMSGVASQDINCRCYIKYDLVDTEKIKKNTAEKESPRTNELGQPYSLQASPSDKVPYATYGKWKKSVEENTGEVISDTRVKKMLDSTFEYTHTGYLDICAASADFSGMWSGYANTMLSDPAKRKTAKAKAEAVEELLSKAPKYNGTVYRGLGFDAGGDYDDGSWDSFVSKMVEGNTIQMDNISSWSAKKSVAEQFAIEKSGNDDEAALMAQVVLKLNNSKSGVGISDLAEKAVQYQEEVLFSKDIKYKVVKIEKTSVFDDDDVENIKMLVELEEVD